MIYTIFFMFLNSTSKVFCGLGPVEEDGQTIMWLFGVVAQKESKVVAKLFTRIKNSCFLNLLFVYSLIFSYSGVNYCIVHFVFHAFLCFIWGILFCSFPQLIMCSWFRSHMIYYAVCKECLTSLSLCRNVFHVLWIFVFVGPSHWTLMV